MNITFYSNVTTKDSVLSYIPQLKEHNVRIYNLNETEEMLKEVSDTEIMISDAMAAVGKKIIDAMPKLKLIQSEGVGYQGIDLEYAKKKRNNSLQ